MPAYLFHQVDAEEFEELCRTLRARRIQPVTFREVLDGCVDPERSVALTFDDGWSSVWSVAFPIARRFEVPITLFVSPALVLDRGERRTTVEDEGAGVTRERDASTECMLTWGELEEMHGSGLVDVQSHSTHHGVVFVSPLPCGVARREGPFPLERLVPALVRRGGEDVPLRSVPPGTRLYPWAPALAAERRWLPAEARWESAAERRARLARDIGGARREIESRLAGARVRALAPPWAVASPEAARTAAETGHEALVLGYPFGSPRDPPIPHYPRLFGDSIWALLDGPVRGLPRWLEARRRARARRRRGGVP